MYSIWFPSNIKGNKSNFVKSYEELIFSEVKFEMDPKYYKKTDCEKFFTS